MLWLVPGGPGIPGQALWRAPAVDARKQGWMLTNYVHRTTTYEAPATLPGPPPPPGGAPDQSPHHTGSREFLLPLLLPRTFGVVIGRLYAVLSDRSVGKLAARP